MARRDTWPRRSGGHQPIPAPRRRRRLHKTRTTIWTTWKVSRWLHRHGWAHRRTLTPLYGAVILLILGAYAHSRPDGVRAAGWVIGLTAAALAAWQMWASRKPRFRRTLALRERIYAATMIALGGGWLLWAARSGPGAPRLGYLLDIVLPTGWAPVLWHYHIRTERTPAATAAPVVPYAEEMALWAEHLGSKTDGIAANSVMHQPVPLRADDPGLAWTARVEIPRSGAATVSTLILGLERVAKAYDTESENVVVDRIDGTSPRWGQVSVFTRNPLYDEEFWPGPAEVFDPATGQMKFARMQTGGFGIYEFWNPGGPAHDLIGGASRQGKSYACNHLLAVERAFGPLMASVIIDPQAGQSLPRWRDQVAMYGRSVDEGREILSALVDEMFRRNDILANHEYLDEFGRKVVGFDSFVPTHPVIRDLGMPLICLTIDEAAMVLDDADSLAYVIQLVTMAGKCGIKLRLLFQTPLLDQVKSTVIRDQLLVGNVITFRLGSAISGGVVLNGFPVEPHKLPRGMKGACYIIGGPNPRPVMARTWPIRDIWEHANAGETTQLPELLAFMGRRTGVPTGTSQRPAAAATVPPQRKDTTYPARILAFLTEHGMATTSVIAQALMGLNPEGKPAKLPAVSQACGRLADAGKIEKVFDAPGLWRMPTVESADLDADVEEVA